MNFLNHFIESDWYWAFWGACALAVLVALVRNIDRQDKPLPKPRCDCIARGGKDHWVVGSARVKS